MQTKKFKILNENGVHARTATTLVNLCMSFSCEITLEAFKKTVDFKSIMGVMSLGIYQGTSIIVTTSGSDEQEAMDTITQKIIELNLGKEI